MWFQKHRLSELVGNLWSCTFPVLLYWSAAPSIKMPSTELLWHKVWSACQWLTFLDHLREAFWNADDCDCVQGQDAFWFHPTFTVFQQLHLVALSVYQSTTQVHIEHYISGKSHSFWRLLLGDLAFITAHHRVKSTSFTAATSLLEVCQWKRFHAYKCSRRCIQDFLLVPLTWIKTLFRWDSKSMEQTLLRWQTMALALLPQTTMHSHRNITPPSCNPSQTCRYIPDHSFQNSIFRSCT